MRSFLPGTEEQPVSDGIKMDNEMNGDFEKHKAKGSSAEFFSLSLHSRAQDSTWRLEALRLNEVRNSGSSKPSFQAVGGSRERGSSQNSATGFDLNPCVQGVAFLENLLEKQISSSTSVLLTLKI